VGEKLEGHCQDFEAVPGLGLKCCVSGLEDYCKETEWKYSKTISREVCVPVGNVNLMVRDIEMGVATRLYQVRVLAQWCVCVCVSRSVMLLWFIGSAFL